jgi:hypothetical protein
MSNKTNSFVVRHKDGGTVEIASYTRTKAIKCMCSECMGFEEDVMGCTDTKCPLYPFRKRTLMNRSRKVEVEQDED